MKKIGIALCAGIITVGLLVTSPAQATKSVAEEILDILKANDQISEQQYKVLMIKVRAEDEKVGATADLSQKISSLEEKVGKKNFLAAYWKDGLRLDAAAGQFRLKIGGRIQNDWAIYGTDKKIHHDFGSIGDGTEFRRAQLFIEGELYSNIEYKAQYEFAGQDADFKDVYIELKKIPMLGALRIGHFKEPFSLQEQTSSKYLTFMERGLPNAFSPSRNTGFMLHNAVLDKRATWAIGAFRDVDDSGSNFGKDSNYNVTTRFTALPWYQEKGKQLLHLGFSYSHKFRDGRDTRFHARPEAHLGPRFVNTKSFAVDGVDLLNPEVALVYGPASMQFEWTTALADSESGSDPNFHGWYISGSYFLTGENLVYKASSGAFGRVTPNNNFDAQGGWGAWELAARYSMLDLDHTNIRGGELDNFTLGLNWYINPNVRLMFNYVRADLDDSGEADIFESRVQVDF